MFSDIELVLKVGSFLRVKGMAPETVPQRRTQSADGFADSQSRHWNLTSSSNASCDCEIGSSVHFNEGPTGEFGFVCGYSNKAGVWSSQVFVAVGLPTSPDSVFALRSSFCLRVNDDSKIRIACRAKESMSSGS